MVGGHKEIRIQIDKDGNVVVEPLNAQGSECVDWTKDIEEALGVAISRELKPQYYESDTETDLNKEKDV